MTKLNKRITSLFLTLIIILSALPILASAASPFKDVKTNHFAYSSIEWAYNEGLIKGYPDGTFQPDRTLTEAQFAAMLIRYDCASPDSFKSAPGKHHASGNKMLFCVKRLRKPVDLGGRYPRTEVVRDHVVRPDDVVDAVHPDTALTVRDRGARVQDPDEVVPDHRASGHTVGGTVAHDGHTALAVVADHVVANRGALSTVLDVHAGVEVGGVGNAAVARERRPDEIADDVVVGRVRRV